MCSVGHKTEVKQKNKDIESINLKTLLWNLRLDFFQNVPLREISFSLSLGLRSSILPNCVPSHVLSHLMQFCACLGDPQLN